MISRRFTQSKQQLGRAKQLAYSSDKSYGFCLQYKVNDEKEQPASDLSNGYNKSFLRYPRRERN